MPDPLDSLNTFTLLKRDVDSETGLFDRFRTKHVRYTAENGIYLHRGFSGSNARLRQEKREKAGEQIWTAIVFEHSLETANAVFHKVLGSSKPRQAVTLDQLDKINAELNKLRSEATAPSRQQSSLTESQQIQQLALRAKTAIRESDKHLYSVVAKAIRDAPLDVRKAVIRELAVYERAVGLTMRSQMEDNLKRDGLALVSERLSIVRSRTVNLLKMLDPDYEPASLSRHEDDEHDDDTTMGRIRNQFNRQNVHPNIDGKTMTQGMSLTSPPQFIASRSGCFDEAGLRRRTGEDRRLPRHRSGRRRDAAGFRGGDPHGRDQARLRRHRGDPPDQRRGVGDAALMSQVMRTA